MHLIGQTPALALLAAGMASIDGEHSVIVYEGKSGTHVKLGHSAKATERMRHEHYGMVYVMTGTGGGEHDDHDLIFAHAEVAMEVNKVLETPEMPDVEVPSEISVFALWDVLQSVETSVCAPHPSCVIDWKLPLPLECGWGTVCLLI